MSASVWEIRYLGTVASMHARIGWQNLRTTEFLDSGDYYLITGTDFEDGHVNFDTCHYVEKKRFAQDINIQLQVGSILITKDGTLGKVAYIDKLNKPATLNAGVFNVIVRDSQTNEKYLFHLLKSPALMNYATIKSTGGTIKHLNQNVLVKFPVVLPKDIQEQKHIADILSTCDTVIQNTQKTIDKYKAIKQGMMQDLFTRGLTKDGKLRPSYKEAPELYKESELGMIPKEWEVDSIENLTTYVDYRGKTPIKIESGIQLVTAKNIKDGFIDYNISKEFIAKEDYNSVMSRGLPKLGDVLFTTEAPVGNVAQINDENVALAQRVIKFRGKEISMDNAFLLYSFLSEYFRRILLSESTGSTAQGIKGSRLHKLLLKYPSIPEQKKINEKLSSIDSTIQKEEAILKKYKNIKTGLMARLLTPPEDAEIIDETGE